MQYVGWSFRSYMSSWILDPIIAYMQQILSSIDGFSDSIAK